MDIARLVPEDEIQGENAAETSELKSMLQQAKEYASSFDWAPSISSAYLGIGIGGVVAVFLLRLDEPVGQERDEYLWVIVGDLPSAYLVTDEASNPVEALRIYCQLMSDWAKAVKSGAGLDVVFPVAAPRDSEHADMLLNRIQFIRERVIPEFRAEFRGHP